MRITELYKFSSYHGRPFPNSSQKFIHNFLVILLKQRENNASNYYILFSSTSADVP